MLFINSFLVLLIFWGICFLGIICNQDKKIVTSIKNSFSVKEFLFLVGLVLFLVFFFTYGSLSTLQSIPYWDYYAFWMRTLNIAEYMKNVSPLQFGKLLLDSINIDEYNILLPAIIAFPLNTMGKSYQSFILLNCLLFLLPTYFIYGLIAVKLVINTEHKPSKIFLLGIFLSAILPIHYYAAFKGYIDVAYLLPLSICIYILVDFDFRRISVSRNISLSLLLILSWVSRRYVVFFIIGFIIAMLIKAFSVIIKDRSLNTIKIILYNFLLIGGISLSILFVFFRQFLFRALFTNYSNIYSAYNAPLPTKIHNLISSYGLFMVIILSIIGFICFRNRYNRSLFVALICMLFATSISFFQVQNMDIHHRMLLSIPSCTILLFLLNYIPTRKTPIRKNDATTSFLFYPCILLLVFNFLFVFSPISSNGKTNFIFPEQYKPLHREDMVQIQTIVNDLNLLTENTSDCIYVAASGHTLNNDTLSKSKLPEQLFAVNNLFGTKEVDLRDGFPIEFFFSKYVVTSSPIELHLYSGQEIIRYFAEGIQNPKSVIGKHYIEIATYELQNEVTAKIYMRIEEFSEEDLRTVCYFFNELYPDSPELFQIPMDNLINHPERFSVGQ